MVSVEDCPICREIPPYSQVSYKGGQREDGEIPAAAGQLAIVGWPYFKEDTSTSNRHLRQCPQCGCVYQWAFTYEYLVNGSEDDISLERLEPEEGARQVEAALAQVRAAQAKFEAEAAPHVAWLRNHGDDSFCIRFAEYMWSRGCVNGFDLTFALPAIREALEAHSHDPAYCKVCMDLHRALEEYASRGPAHRQRLAGALAPADLSHCEARIRVLAGRD